MALLIELNNAIADALPHLFKTIWVILALRVCQLLCCYPVRLCISSLFASIVLLFGCIS
jgi:hypothetical protein